MPMHTIEHRRKKMLGPKKAKKMLEHGEVKGRPLTAPQKGLFGLIAGGGTPTRTRKRRRKRGA